MLSREEVIAKAWMGEDPWNKMTQDARDQAIRKAVSVVDALTRLNNPNETLTVDGYTFNLDRRQIWKGSTQIASSPRIYDVALYLAQLKGQVCPNRTILLAVWGPAHVDNIQYLRVYVAESRIAFPDINIVCHSKIGYEWVGPK